MLLSAARQPPQRTCFDAMYPPAGPTPELPDFEYQEWPQFTYGAMNTAGISAGIRVRLF